MYKKGDNIMNKYTIGYKLIKNGKVKLVYWHNERGEVYCSAYRVKYSEITLIHPILLSVSKVA